MQMNNPWIDAYWEPNEDIYTFNSCLALSDLEHNKEHKFICVNFSTDSPQLKIFKGCSVSAETVLPDIPSAIISFYTDTNESRIPGIAVSSGSQVLIYRNARPYFKLQLPLIDLESNNEFNNIEADIWTQKTDVDQLVRLLHDLSVEHGFSNLSTPSQHLLATDPDKRVNYLNEKKHQPIKKQMVICCMTKIAKSLEAEKYVECLIVATESAHLFVIDPETFSTVQQNKLPGVVSNMAAEGAYTVDYTIVLITRCGIVYKLQRGSNDVVAITNLSALPVAFILDNDRVLTANMDCTLQSFTIKGAKEWSVSLKGSPIGLSAIPSYISESTVVVACNVEKADGIEGVTYIYKGTELLYTLYLPEPVQAFIFGTFGYGEQAFIFNMQGGGLAIKLLKRNAYFGTNDKCATLGSSIPHNVKLLIPKKSKTFVEQTLHEREHAKEIYTWFQKSWLGMQILCCESYLNALQDASIPEDETLKLSAQVIGLGPRLKMQIHLKNIRDENMLTDVAITFLYDKNVYTLHSPYLQIPLMIPNFQYELETYITCEMNITSSVTLLVSTKKGVILTATVNMPSAIAASE